MSTLPSTLLVDSVANLKYFNCPKRGLHQGESLNRVCIDKNCAQHGLICVICEEEEHREHDTIPVKQFLNILVGENKNKHEAAVKNLVAIEQMRSEVEEAITSKRKEIQQELQKLQNEATRYFDQVDRLAKNLFQTEGPIQKIVEDLIYGNQENLPNIMKRMKTVLQIVDIGESRQFSIQKLLQHLAADTAEKGAKVSQTLNKIVTDSAKTIQTLTQMLGEAVTLPEKIDSYKWSEKMKGAKITINGLVAEQTGMESSGQRFILMEQDLSSNLRKKCWAVKIKKFVGWIGVGISLKSQIIHVNYNFHYTTIGHGSYLISTNGYSWSHSVKEYNSSFKCFTFAVGDTIHIEYNPLIGKLKFRKNESQEAKDQFQLDVSPPPKGDSYHPSANLCNAGDSVEIVNRDALTL